MADPKSLEQLATLGAEACRMAGADAADAFVTQGSQMSVDIYEGAPEMFEQAGVSGAGIRAFRDGRMGYAYTADLSESALTATAKTAFENAAASDTDEFNGLPDLEENYPDAAALGLTSEDFYKATTKDKIEFALRVEAEAKGYDARVKGCESVAYAEEAETIALANTNGFTGSYTRQTCYGFADAMAGDNDEVQTGFSYEAGRSLAELDAAFIGREAAERATVMLGGRPMAPATMTVVFDPLVFIQVLGAISPALSAEAAQKGRSFLSSSVGKKMAPDFFSLVDDGILSGGIASAPFDDEGSAAKTTFIVENGVLKTLLFNTYAARKAGLRPTGNGRRGSFKNPPGTSPTNLFVQPGDRTRLELIEETGDGLYVMGLQGLHAGVSAVTGQFSAGAYGLRIRDGKLAEPVREITIASTCAKILANIAAVAGDLRFVPMGAGYGSPTVAVRDMVVSGR